MRRILIVDDEPLKRASLVVQLTDDGFEVASAGDGDDAIAAFERLPADVVLTDLRMPRVDGLALLGEIKSRWPATDVILFTAYGTVESAVEAMRRGAHDYLLKPVRYEELKLRLDRLFELRAKTRENESLRARLEAETRHGAILGRSSVMRDVFDRLRAITDSDASVLVVGETGTGKSLLASTLHSSGPRKSGPFVQVSCAALNRTLIESELFGREPSPSGPGPKRGRFELAKGGTILLDNVDDVPLEVQTKLLRVLEERRFERVDGEASIEADVRVVAATKVDLLELVRQNLFRADLYYRLNVVTIQLPPLRARGDDVLLLAEELVQRVAVAKGKAPKLLSTPTLQALSAHPWPGNVRELLHAMERAFLFSTGPTIEPGDLPETIRRAPEAVDLVRSDPAGFGLRIPSGVERVNLEEALALVERELIHWALAKVAGKQSRAAEVLGIPRTTLRTRMERHGLLSGDAPQGPASAAPGVGGVGGEA